MDKTTAQTYVLYVNNDTFLNKIQIFRRFNIRLFAVRLLTTITCFKHVKSFIYTLNKHKILLEVYL